MDIQKLREEFEKLPEISDRIDGWIAFRNDRYWNKSTGYVEQYLTGAWYAFQEQQKDSDKLKQCIIELVSQKNKANAKLDNIQEILELKTSGSFTSVMRKIDAISEELLK